MGFGKKIKTNITTFIQKPRQFNYAGAGHVNTQPQYQYPNTQHSHSHSHNIYPHHQGYHTHQPQQNIQIQPQQQPQQLQQPNYYYPTHNFGPQQQTQNIQQNPQMNQNNLNNDYINYRDTHTGSNYDLSQRRESNTSQHSAHSYHGNYTHQPIQPDFADLSKTGSYHDLYHRQRRDSTHSTHSLHHSQNQPKADIFVQSYKDFIKKLPPNMIRKDPITGAIYNANQLDQGQSQGGQPQVAATSYQVQQPIHNQADIYPKLYQTTVNREPLSKGEVVYDSGYVAY